MDNKLKELDVMISLFESKLQSLPNEITSTYPELTTEKLGDFSSFNIKPNTINSQQNNNIEPSQQPVNAESTNNNVNNTQTTQNNVENPNENFPENQNTNNTGETEVQEETPQDRLDKFLKENPQLERVYRAILRKIPSYTLIPQSKLSGFSDSILNELVRLYKEVDPTYI